MTRLVSKLSLLVLLMLTPVLARAQASPDEPAAILVFPYVTVDSANSTYTTIQISNTADHPVEARCFYENHTPECSSGEPDSTCLTRPTTCDGVCIPRDQRTPLRLRLTPFQPIAWQVSDGLRTLPLDGVNTNGPGESNNQFSSVPGVGNGPFIGTLRCVAVDLDPNRPLRENILVGVATIEHVSNQPQPSIDRAQYRAVGVRAIEAATNRDEFLTLGGPAAEYESCPSYATLEHFFDGALIHSGDSAAAVSTTLAVVNCADNPVGLSNNVVQFLAYNEFDQRFSTSRSVRNQLVTPLSNIDSLNPERSIFWYQVVGTIGGHTIIRGVDSGVHVVALTTHSGTTSPVTVHSDAINPHGYGSRSMGDVLAYRPPRCDGDCNLDGEVNVDEIVTGVNMAFTTSPIEACVPVDANSDSEVTIDEIVRAINSALDGCPPPVAPTPQPTPTAAPTVPTPDSVGPAIVHFGLASADDLPLQPSGTDSMGRPIFTRPFGQGMTMVVEASEGTNRRLPGTSTYSAIGERPDLQILVSRPLGDGGAAVCEASGRRGGIPAVPSLDFNADPTTTAAINDLGCRAYETSGNSASMACTRQAGSTFGFVNATARTQFCIPIAKAWAFPPGDTVVAARVRDVAGNLGAVREIVVRVGP